MPKKNNKPTIMKQYVKLSKFAKLKNISRTTVYRHIKDGHIRCEFVGVDADPYIDFEIYNGYLFSKKHK